MTQEEKILVEAELFYAIKAFHDSDDKIIRETYVRNYFFEFCKRWKINTDEALNMIKNLFNEERRCSNYKFEHFNDLDSIIFPGKAKSTDRDDR